MLNMLSTSIMIRMGRVKGNRMVNMQLTNAKLWDRGTRMIMNSTDLSYDDAHALLEKHGSVKEALAAYNAEK
jgi:N-acetylmuramic acid 6-phosphate etherase